MDLLSMGNRLKELMRQKGITQRELSEAIYVTEVTISRYANGKRMPKLEILITICNYFGCSLDFLVLGRG